MNGLGAKTTIFRTVARFDIDNATEIDRIATTSLTDSIGRLAEEEDIFLSLDRTEGEGFSEGEGIAVDDAIAQLLQISL
jgi:hypothetical protein